MPTRLPLTAMTQSCDVHTIRSKWYRSPHSKRLRNRLLLLKSRSAHATIHTIDERAQRTREYEQAFARLTKDDKIFLRQTHVAVDEPLSTEEQFRKLAAEWLDDVGPVSSVTELTSHPKYKEIIGLGWDVVPFLLRDLQHNRGFWFTALSEITGIRPFDRQDAGNGKLMAEAWIQWGRNKNIKF